VDSVVGADQEIGTDFREFICRGEHELTHALPVAAVDVFHVLGERVRMHRDFGMIVVAEKLRAFHVDGSITKRRAFGGAGNNTNVVGHDLILQRRHDLTDSCCGFAKLTVLPVVAAPESVSCDQRCRLRGGS